MTTKKKPSPVNSKMWSAFFVLMNCQLIARLSGCSFIKKWNTKQKLNIQKSPKNPKESNV